MRSHGNTVFIPENQEKRVRNGWIINELWREVRVDVDVMERRDERARSGTSRPSVPIGLSGGSAKVFRRMLKMAVKQGRRRVETGGVPLGRTVRRIRSTTSVRAAESVRRPGPR